MSVGTVGLKLFVGTIIGAREMKTVFEGVRDETRILVQSFQSAGDEALLYS